MADFIWINNECDKKFSSFIKTILSNSEEELMTNLKNELNKLKTDKPNIYNQLLAYYLKYDFWGIIDEENNNYENFTNRIKCLKTYLVEFMWLYYKLEDYQSKYTLYCILLNWLNLDTYNIAKVNSIFNQYFDLDLFHINKDEIFVDCGAYSGDTLLSYINTYGKDFKKYYAYEINNDFINTLEANISLHNIENVIVKNYGLSDKEEELYIKENLSASKVSETGNKKVKLVKLDDNLQDVPTFIKMDIEGYEEKAILGSKEIIKNYSPNLAIAVYHGYNDLWKLPRLINEINPNYNFYLRHYGGNLVPTEFILYCKRKEK